MKIKYGNIEADVIWNWPTKEIFDDWKKDFFKLDETKFFEIYVAGRFLDTLAFGKQVHTQDVDIILVGDKDIKKIEKLIYEGTRLGLKKYQTFFDVLWFDKLPVYAHMKKGEVVEVDLCILSDKWIVDGRIQKQYTNIKQLSENLWNMKITYPTLKQKKRMNEGYSYLKPLRIL
tara:strand:+ start:673 stop:1194 length:522 start_codon:yes stop_codon:yes gene_type:complete